MTVINKQKFLAELGKLLTFMYEEDRKRAIALYAKIFDDAPSEQDALQLLGSPTRQAVIVARAYNAKERKLQVEAQSRELEEDEESPDTPDYVLAILELYDQVVPEHAVSVPLEDQVSLFDEPEEEEPEAEPVEPVELPIPAPLPVEPVELPPEPDVEEERAPELEKAPAPITEDEVDAFLESFTIEGDELIDRENEAEAEGDVALDEDLSEDEEADEEEEPEAEAEPEDDEDEYEDEEDEDEAEAPASAAKRKVRPLLLILYLIVAIPVCAALITLLLVPAALCLGLAVGVIAAGAALMVTAFSSFAVLADILLVVGAALVVLAVGLLLLWLFVWFIGGPIVGLIRGAVRLGGRWCTKEVAA